MPERVLVTLDHEVLDADAPFLHADDLAVVRGDGVFETLLVRDGRARVVEGHLSRLVLSARALGLPAPVLDDWRLAIEMAAEEWGTEKEGALRLVLTRGRESGDKPTAFVMVGPVADRVRQVRESGLSVMTLERGFSVDLSARAPWQLLGAKTLSYATNMAALRYAANLGADDVIFVSSEGNVLEGPRSTVVIVRDRTLITPPPAQGILMGTTQRALFDVAGSARFDCRYETLRPADLIAADGVWMVSSVTLAACVHTLDGLALPEPKVSEEFAELVERAIDSDSAGR
ncbi:aminodeoxychorismate lyase [Rhodococcus erythropolis]|uniref:aminodeoxychorismate lyase n=1 Tax=Rhodococcus erythropolis TaxID=1833 RepID=UPI001E425687|nr:MULTISPECIES: aminodeoxychorismate lyase [Rhodococcus erythropolis group]MCD2105846.1 aminodeoxychorismate lyase [Rhodococcus qingshengii]MCZ4523549.1 aminodeoxychorismate lyase [Rhodococcus erythropolis]